MPKPSAALPGGATPRRDCSLCPRLAAFRQANRQGHADWHNAPVDSFGALDGRLLIVGLAPGLRGANRTGRPFTGDSAGDLLYASLIKFGFAAGRYAADPGDGLQLKDCRITNAVRCVPPENKPTAAEITTCRNFLAAEIEAMETLAAILALGRIAHDAVIKTLGSRLEGGLRLKDWPFRHGARHQLPPPLNPRGLNPRGPGPGLALYDSYHCSRLNTNTGRLTEAMFVDVLAAIRAFLDGASDEAMPS